MIAILLFCYVIWGNYDVEFHMIINLNSGKKDFILKLKKAILQRLIQTKGY